MAISNSNSNTNSNWLINSISQVNSTSLCEFNQSEYNSSPQHPQNSGQPEVISMIRQWGSQEGADLPAKDGRTAFEMVMDFPGVFPECDNDDESWTKVREN